MGNVLEAVRCIRVPDLQLYACAVLRSGGGGRGGGGIDSRSVSGSEGGGTLGK